MCVYIFRLRQFETARYTSLSISQNARLLLVLVPRNLRFIAHESIVSQIAVYRTLDREIQHMRLSSPRVVYS